MGIHPSLASIFSAHGLEPSGSGPVFRTANGEYYGKVARSRRAADQMRGEAASLAAMLRTAPPGLVPRVLGYVDADVGALVTEYADGRGGRGGRQAALGRALAEMHCPPPSEAGAGGGEAVAQNALDKITAYTGKFGFPVPTHCGVTEQDNTWTESWEEFFRDRRLGDLVRRIGEARVNKAWGRCKERAVPLLLGNITPPPVPVPLHGDLWPGNVAGATIYDPAGYYGHGEADLGMTRMFGGFSQAFYDAYHSIHPQSQPHYDQRIRLYELYHHLNHALMFGGGYTGGAVRIMDELADWAEGVRS
ncbi:uncharacterized protein CcaverHIS019_0109070 [Cutaneotrichosporon cavernicola]|uniref:protein-ribulosamine 3-kinase n=1 Tax=Cutaneotrichosporon cavernicola TaxID=279322 RepID=A0AA48KXE1_9TREE|nr:uncharacterized protein CcaverHIS019_0109070 [Cutaneotrichosporon cavernicola]BEI88189.1 hypothetical protein CcaverHIS019_0109070 [Cutaneotrichosporon cavernicola]BEI95961.1 hypothetical protein CcaverHIS631_0109100 [Cutaneotrichosporon cavernicola]BEJ03734.1 hypothetical protein CcaverHIS641_0109090 [Cutaneotrichosporon cavernicola]